MSAGQAGWSARGRGFCKLGIYCFKLILVIRLTPLNRSGGLYPHGLHSGPSLDSSSLLPYSQEQQLPATGQVDCAGIPHLCWIVIGWSMRLQKA
jgi:hypothetical protein